MSRNHFNPKQYKNFNPKQHQDDEEEDWLDEDENLRKPQKVKVKKFKEYKAQ